MFDTADTFKTEISSDLQNICGEPHLNGQRCEQIHRRNLFFFLHLTAFYVARPGVQRPGGTPDSQVPFNQLVEFFGETFFPSGLHCCPHGEPLWNGKALSIKTIYESF